MAYNFPSNPSLNDTYSYGGRSFVWNGVQWVQVGGTEGLVPKIFVSSSPPPNPKNGILWYKTVPGETGLFVWVDSAGGGSWQPSGSGSSPNCGPVTTVSVSPPLSPSIGDLWFNPGTSELAVWVTGLGGNYWEVVNFAGGCVNDPTVTTSTSPPPNPEVGDLWFDPETSTLSIWYQDLDSSQWVVIVPYTQSLLPDGDDGQFLIAASNTSFGVAWTNYINGGTF